MYCPILCGMWPTFTDHIQAFHLPICEGGGITAHRDKPNTDGLLLVAMGLAGVHGKGTGHGTSRGEYFPTATYHLVHREELVA